jgi:hypothetical protein
MAHLRFPKGLSPVEELFDLLSSCPHLDARERFFIPVDGHRGVRGLVRVDTDYHLHEYLLDRVGTRRALLLAVGSCSILF